MAKPTLRQYDAEDWPNQRALASKPRAPKEASRRGVRLSEASGNAQTLILPRVARGDPGATRECIDRFGGLVWSIARRLMIPDVQIEDAVQDVFVEVWKNASRYDEAIASESTFVAMIARRRLIDQLRKLSRQPRTSALSEGIEAEAKAGGWRGTGTPKGSLEREVHSEDAAAAADALDQLSMDQQRVLRLSIYRGLSHDLIALVLGIPLGTVKTHARRGLIRIREMLSLVPGERSDGSPMNGGSAAFVHRPVSGGVRGTPDGAPRGVAARGGAA